MSDSRRSGRTRRRLAPSEKYELFVLANSPADPDPMRPDRRIAGQRGQTNSAN
ncbi:MAG: hypothetical protein JO100_16670 [Pseudonocardia sp.]|nr:hypothetical protein [Pseudonocardia sp.]